MVYVTPLPSSHLPAPAPALSLSQVQAVALTHKQGLFNPYTLTGTIVVDGILASAHRQVYLILA